MFIQTSWVSIPFKSFSNFRNQLKNVTGIVDNTLANGHLSIATDAEDEVGHLGLEVSKWDSRRETELLKIVGIRLLENLKNMGLLLNCSLSFGRCCRLPSLVVEVADASLAAKHWQWEGLKSLYWRFKHKVKPVRRGTRMRVILWSAGDRSYDSVETVAGFYVAQLTPFYPKSALSIVQHQLMRASWSFGKRICTLPGAAPSAS